MKRLGFLSFILFCSKKDFFSPEKKPGDTFIAVVKKKRGGGGLLATISYLTIHSSFFFSLPYFLFIFGLGPKPPSPPPPSLFC